VTWIAGRALVSAGWRVAEAFFDQRTTGAGPRPSAGLRPVDRRGRPPHCSARLGPFSFHRRDNLSMRLIALIVGCSVALAQPQSLVRDTAPQTETLAGNFVMAIEENFQTRTVKSTRHLLQSPPHMLQFVLPDPSQVRGWRSGSPVQVTGHRAGAQFLVDSIKTVPAGLPSGHGVVQPRATSETVIPASGQRTVALIPFTTQNQPTPVLDQSTGQAIMQAVHDYYEENSYGQLDMVSRVFPALNLPITVECSASDLATVWSALQPVASQSGINLVAFDSVIMVGPGYGDCVGTGVGAAGWPAPEPALVRPQTALAPLIWASLVSHEIGHHLGLDLADAINCGTAIIYDPRTNCTSEGGADPADTMGLGPGYESHKVKDLISTPASRSCWGGYLPRMSRQRGLTSFCPSNSLVLAAWRSRPQVLQAPITLNTASPSAPIPASSIPTLTFSAEPWCITLRVVRHPLPHISSTCTRPCSVTERLILLNCSLARPTWTS
jgi:hypothetical protein